MFKLKATSAAVLIIMGVAAVPAFAQEKLERVEVTGTRIKSIGAVSSSPVTSVSAAEINSSQPVAVEEVVKGLPAAVPAIGAGTNNGTGGGATLDLRGLGSQRSLVLIDGRRLVPFNLDGQVDTNSIPVSLLRRIDLVTGGASAVYGADAVAGVANFVLNRQFQGIELSSSYGSSGEGDAKRRRTDLTMGGALAEGRGNFVLSLGTTKTDELRQGARSIGASALSSVTGNPQGSGTGVPSGIQIGSVAGLPAGTPSLANVQIDPATGRLVAPFNSYNFNPLNFFVTPLDRMQATALGSFVVNDHAEVYADLFYTRANVLSNLAPSGTFFNVYNVPIGNPFLPEAARQQICQVRGISAANCVLGNATEVPMAIGRRFTELGPRINDFKNKSMQGTIGVKGAINDTWSYDAYISKGESSQTQSRVNWGSLSKVQQALRAVAAGQCQNTANGCVPLNVFGAEGSITPEMIKFINLSSVTQSEVEQQVLAASVSGDLGKTFKSPWTNDVIGVAIGLEQREVTASNFSDGASQIQGEVLGTGAPTPDRTGTLKLNELYAEASVPLVKNMPLIHKLALELGYRHTQFKTTSSTEYGSWKFGGDWEPVRGVRVRAMSQRATRAPSINELYAPQVSGLSNLAVDPCQGDRINQGQANTAGTLSNLCRLTGVPVPSIGTLPAPSAGQINNLTGGNAALGPEEANTKTLGIVFQPDAIPNLLLSLDYYQIDLNKAVSSPSTSDILNDCYDPARNAGLTLNSACALVKRGPLGTFNGADSPGVVTPQSNLGKIWTRGFDIGVNYRVELGKLVGNASLGRVDLSFNANIATKHGVQSTPSSVVRDCLGFYSVACGNLNGNASGFMPKSKFTQRASWNMGDWTVGYNWRHVGKMVEEPVAPNFLPAFSTIKAANYVDLSAAWNVNKNLRLNLSINNAFDKDAPLVGNTIATTTQNSGNTFPQVYDVVGRYFTLGATLKF